MTNSFPLVLPVTPETVQNTITAWSAVASLVAGAVVHFTHLAITKWSQAGGIEGIKVFIRYGKNAPTATITAQPLFPPNMGEVTRPFISEPPKPS